jgi:uncharacterized protein YdeI (YjbR/CyaY-like superfamily)
MGKKDRRIDAYIDNSADFAKPILRQLRQIVHRGCPDVEETMKWSFPHFDYKGVMISMAVFKAHCVLNFWKAPLMNDPHEIMNKTGMGDAMGHFGKITSLADLPKKEILISYVREAAKLNEEGIKIEKKMKPRKELKVPTFFHESLKKNKKALATFENFSPSAKREYVEWVTEAKREETRTSRLKTAVEWMSEGKQRNWKYMKK